MTQQSKWAGVVLGTQLLTACGTGLSLGDGEASTPRTFTLDDVTLAVTSVDHNYYTGITVNTTPLATLSGSGIATSGSPLTTDTSSIATNAAASVYARHKAGPSQT